MQYQTYCMSDTQLILKPFKQSPLLLNQNAKAQKHSTATVYIVIQYIVICITKTTRSKCRPDSVRTLLTLMDGNIFWNIVAISLRCMPSPLKWFMISKGWQRNWDWVAWFRFSIDTTSRLSEYETTLNVIVGPRGKRINRICVDASDLENVTRWVTLSGPATLTKSFSTFFLLTCICTAYKTRS